MFLEMFEDEFRQMQLNPVRIEYLLKDACMLYPPTTTPLSDVEFIKRLPSGDIERARRVSERAPQRRKPFDFLRICSRSACSSCCERCPWICV